MSHFETYTPPVGSKGPDRVEGICWQGEKSTRQCNSLSLIWNLYSPWRLSSPPTWPHRKGLHVKVDLRKIHTSCSTQPDVMLSGFTGHLSEKNNSSTITLSGSLGADPAAPCGSVLSFFNLATHVHLLCFSIWKSSFLFPTSHHFFLQHASCYFNVDGESVFTQHGARR